MSDFEEPERPKTARLSDLEIKALKYNMQTTGPQPGDVYEHYKGGLYSIVGQCMHKDTRTFYVVYHSNLLGMNWLQPLSEFEAVVTLDDGTRVPRFRHHPK